MAKRAKNIDHGRLRFLRKQEALDQLFWTGNMRQCPDCSGLTYGYCTLGEGVVKQDEDALLLSESPEMIDLQVWNTENDYCPECGHDSFVKNSEKCSLMAFQDDGPIVR